MHQLQPVYNTTIDLLLFVTVLSEQQQENLHVLGMAARVFERRVDRAVNGRWPARLSRAMADEVRQRAQRSAHGCREPVHACMRACNI